MDKHSSGALEAGEALAAQNAPAPDNLVSLQQMHADVAGVEYLYPAAAPHMTIAAVRLHNGYMLVGKSAPVDPANFDEEKGKTFAYEDALRQLWALKGFALVDQRHRAD